MPQEDLGYEADRDRTYVSGIERGVRNPTLRINKKVDEAKAAYQKALDATPPHPKAAVKLALVLYDAGQYPEAEVFLTDMLAKDPKTASLYYNLGWVYSAQKKYKLGADAFEKYLSLAPKEDSARGKAARMKETRRTT